MYRDLGVQNELSTLEKKVFSSESSLADVRMSFKVKDEIQFPPFYGQYNVQKGAKQGALGMIMR